MVTATYPPKSTEYNQGEGLMGHTMKKRKGNQKGAVGSGRKLRWKRVGWKEKRVKVVTRGSIRIDFKTYNWRSKNECGPTERKDPSGIKRSVS